MRSNDETAGIIEDIGRELRAHIAKKYDSHAEAAAALGINPTSLSSMLAGRRAPAEVLLADAGIRREKPEPYYVRIERRKGRK